MHVADIESKKEFLFLDLSQGETLHLALGSSEPWVAIQSGWARLQCSRYTRGNNDWRLHHEQNYCDCL